jgi:hypothetical protein
VCFDPVTLDTLGQQVREEREDPDARVACTMHVWPVRCGVYPTQSMAGQQVWEKREDPEAQAAMLKELPSALPKMIKQVRYV